MIMIMIIVATTLELLVINDGHNAINDDSGYDDSDNSNSDNDISFYNGNYDDIPSFLSLSLSSFPSLLVSVFLYILSFSLHSFTLTFFVTFFSFSHSFLLFFSHFFYLLYNIGFFYHCLFYRTLRTYVSCNR